MPLVPVRVEAISNGKLVDAINKGLTQIAKDVIERPTLKKPRKLKVEVAIEPDLDPETKDNHPDIQWSIGMHVPGIKGTRHTAKVQMGKTGEPLLFLNTDEEVNPNQLRFEDSNGDDPEFNV